MSCSVDCTTIGAYWRHLLKPESSILKPLLQEFMPPYLDTLVLTSFKQRVDLTELRNAIGHFCVGGRLLSVWSWWDAYQSHDDRRGQWSLERVACALAEVALDRQYQDVNKVRIQLAKGSMSHDKFEAYLRAENLRTKSQSEQADKSHKDKPG
jgi:hypothetical protein